jgi:hypothetical protein
VIAWKKIARRESNGISAVCRRLLTEALDRVSLADVMRRGLRRVMADDEA